MRPLPDVALLSLPSSFLALSKLPKRPKLLPIIMIVSNVPSLEFTCDYDLTSAFLSPLCLQTSMASGELSMPTTSSPFSWR